MLDDIDVYRCAHLLMLQHGSQAELKAARRVDELEAAGDDDGRRAWLRILAGINDLRRSELRPGERLQ